MPYVKGPRPKKMREIREFQRMAYKVHVCEECDGPIRLKEEYFGKVFTGSDGRVYEMKTHINCPSNPYGGGTPVQITHGGAA